MNIIKEMWKIKSIAWIWIACLSELKIKIVVRLIRGIIKVSLEELIHKFMASFGIPKVL